MYFIAYDLVSRFPAAKLVSSTKSEKVIPALKEIYNSFGNPQMQSENEPSFKAQEWISLQHKEE